MLPAKKRLWIEISLHLLFWAGVLYVLTSLDSPHIHVFNMARLLARGSFVARDQVLISFISTYVYLILFFLAALFYGNVFWVFKKVLRFRQVIIRLALCVGWFAIVFGANYFVVGPSFDQANPVPEPPVEKAMPARRDTQLGHIQPDTAGRRHIDPAHPPHINAISFTITDWLQIQPVLLLAFLVIEGIAVAYFFLNAWAKSELIQSRLQANQLSTEIKFLKSQVNPHFLFNTLNNLFSMAQDKGNDELADGISKLSGMMRYMLYDSNEETVPLDKEITYLEECITLNKLRYDDEEVRVTFEHPGPGSNIPVAPMLFIPFVENAFKHGVAIGQQSAIDIAIAVAGQKLLFTCINRDYSFIKKMHMEISGIGLENVKRRLELVYPNKHHLVINKEKDKFMVQLEINLS
ncbi:MAG: sensor histidine kinase [Bacteroidetes bacterium]|nr:sensor histidine kinase [Bacteroidota bacterium]